MVFNGFYSQNFDVALAGGATNLPNGFHALVLPQPNGTFSPSNPVTANAIAAAIIANRQDLVVWNCGSPVTDSSLALYNIGSATNLNDRALGPGPAGANPIVIELTLSNNTGGDLMGVSFNYDLKTLPAGNATGPSPGFAFFYSTSGGATEAEWTGVSALSLTNDSSGATVSSGAVTVLFSALLTNNGIMYFRWADESGQGRGQMPAIDNIAISALNNAQLVRRINTVFVIAMENHNFTQPNPTALPQQILGSPAAPFLNSLVTPGNSNATQVSYAANYYQVGSGVHPSEPNYIWAEAGTDFGFHQSAEPSAEAGNLFDAPHLTRQLNSAGVTWKNYQEDVQFSASPANTAFGTSATNINPYYGSGEYGYAPKHNPMVFFTDTQDQNVYPLTSLTNDLAGNVVGRYNWITPNTYNDQHSILSGGFTYHGVAYTGDQAAVAQGDSFLAVLVPQIMASTAYQNNGVIIIRWDETEMYDDTNATLGEIIISPLAKGNAYASHVVMSHSSDVRTMEEIFGLPLLTNPIPENEVTAFGFGYNDVATASDLSDLFLDGTPPEIDSGDAGKVKILAHQIMPNQGGFQMTFSGPLGRDYQVLASDDPSTPRISWIVLGGGTFSATNSTFLDVDSTNHSSRFYLIKSL